jgi:hypothetical protein
LPGLCLQLCLHKNLPRRKKKRRKSIITMMASLQSSAKTIRRRSSAAARSSKVRKRMPSLSPPNKSLRKRPQVIPNLEKRLGRAQ